MGNSWANVAPPSDTDPDEWEITAELEFSDADSWKAHLPSGVSASATFLGVSETPDDFDVDPEDVELEPEEVQADCDDWTIMPEFT